MPDNTDLVSLTIDGIVVRVPKGTNLIEAAITAGIDIPFYCYHRHLSVAGNCRMCQVEVEGSPKLTIACNTGAQEGMVVRTQRTSEKTAEAQRATLEFLLINHPLDCTVCDQAGHCKLQDYYYEYNAKPSRFVEEKVHKVKAEPLGPEVIYDGERCILCTRCVRFCEEVTGTGELGLFERGDHAVIGIHPGKEINNALSGSVVDLCPVGALTHRRWRFNSRIWYAGEKKSVCAGCSTGCSVQVAVRDDVMVQVKGRLNSEVNHEWLCDEGRYGFDRFQPRERLSSALVREGNYLEPVTLEAGCKAAAQLATATPAGTSALFMSPFLTLEEMWVTLAFAETVMGIRPDSGEIAVQLKRRNLTKDQAVLVSPDYSPNARAANLFGIGLGNGDWRERLETGYFGLLQRLRQGGVKRVLLVGDFALRDEDLDESIISALLQTDVSVALTPRGVIDGEPHATEESATEAFGAVLGAHQLCKVILPSRTVNEKNGILVNKDMRFQRLGSLVSAPFGSFTEWMLLHKVAKQCNRAILSDKATDDRAVFREMVAQYEPLSGLTLAGIGEFGMSWDSFQELRANESKQPTGEARAS